MNTKIQYFVVYDNVMNTVWYKVWINVRNIVFNNVRDTVDNNVYDTVRNKILFNRKLFKFNDLQQYKDNL